MRRLKNERFDLVVLGVRDCPRSLVAELDNAITIVKTDGRKRYTVSFKSNSHIYKLLTEGKLKDGDLCK